MAFRITIEHVFFTLHEGDETEISINVEFKDSVLDICTYRIDYIFSGKTITEIAVFKHHDIQSRGLMMAVFDRFGLIQSDINSGLF